MKPFGEPDDPSLSGIEYHGQPGSSLDCEAAVWRLIQCNIGLSSARIITANGSHALMLFTTDGSHIAIKSGFASDYGGLGPLCFSQTLQLLVSHNVAIDEWETDEKFIDRLDRSALTLGDLHELTTGSPSRNRWQSYIRWEDDKRAQDGSLWEQVPPVMPFAIIDPRIADLARSFWIDPDAHLNRGYRRLEDVVRKRIDVHETGPKLFSQAFGPERGRLTWDVPDASERVGRAQLFSGAFMAYRNPRAHREKPGRGYWSEVLSEFLLLNQLFRLEAEACDRTDSSAEE